MGKSTDDTAIEPWDRFARTHAARLPMPMAWSLVRLGKRQSSADALTSWKLLLDLFELTVRGLTGAALGAHVHFGSAHESLNASIVRRLGKRISLGDWWALLRDAVRVPGDSAFLAVLVDLLYDGTRPSRLHGDLEEVITARNRQFAHGTAGTESQYRDLIARHSPAVQQLLVGLRRLGPLALIAVTATGDETEGISLMGPRASLFPEPIDPELMPDGTQEGDVVLVLTERGEGFPVFPMQLFEEDIMEERVELFLLDGLNNTGSGISSITYQGVSTRAHRTLNERDVANRRAVELLERLFGAAIETTVAGSSAPARVVVDFYPQEQRELVARHNRLFAGREELVDTLLDRDEPALFVVTAPPGQGKSALAAQVCSRTTNLHHFFSVAGGRTSGLAGLQSLCSQLAAMLGIDVELHSDSNEVLATYRHLLHQALEQVRAHGDRMHLVIDALDESDDSFDLCCYFPDPIPPGMVGMVTSRPSALVDTLHQRSDAIRILLGPLNIDEIAHAVERAGVIAARDQVSRLYQLSRGNPLLLRMLLGHVDTLDELRTAEGSDLDGWYGTLLSKVAMDVDQLRMVLAVLAVTRRPLNAAELSSVLAISRRLLVPSMVQLRELLAQEGGRFSLFHYSLAEFLRGTSLNALDDDEITAAHRAFVDAARGEGALGSDYRLEHVPDHLLALGDVDALVGMAAEREHIDPVGSALGRALSTSTDGRAPNTAEQALRRLATDEPASLRSTFIAALHALLRCGEYELVERHVGGLPGGQPADVVDQLTVVLARADREQGRLNSAVERVSPLLLAGRDAAWRPVDRFELRTTLASTLRESGHFDQSERYYEEATRILTFESSPDRWLEAEHHLADLRFVKGDLVQALDRLEYGLKLAVEHGLTLRAGQLYRIRGHVHYLQGAAEASDRAYSCALQCFTEINDSIHVAKVNTNLAETAALHAVNPFLDDTVTVEARTSIPSAHELLDEAERLNTRFHQGLELGKTYKARSMVLRAEGRLDEAAGELQRARTQLLAVGYTPGIALCDLLEADLALELGEHDRAREAAAASERSFLSDDASYPVYRAICVIVQLRAGATVTELDEPVRALGSLADVPVTRDTLQSELERARRGR